MTSLSCAGLTVRFGAFVAVDGVSLAFAPGKITGLVGPNGAGKTTLLNAMSGRFAPSSGRIHLAGQDITGHPAKRLSRLGLARSFQITQVFSELSVGTNLALMLQAKAWAFHPFWRAARAVSALEAQARSIADEHGLADEYDIPARDLSHGRQRVLEIAMAVATRPQVLLLDEPLAGIGHDGIAAMIATIRRVAEGRTVILVEHNMQAVMQLCDEIVVLARGRILAAGSPDEIRSNTLVRKTYLGETELA